jgi:hypothetical protein
MAGEFARFEFTKWDGGQHWHFDTYRLGDDSHGQWFGARTGTQLQRGLEPPIRWPCAFTMLVPSTGDWVATFNAEGKYLLYIDVTGPITVDGDVIRAADLDLDVVRTFDGTVKLLDEDEFAEHQLRYGYPDAVIGRALATAQWLVRAVAAGQEPFATVGQQWLSQVTELAAQPPSGITPQPATDDRRQ